MDNKINNDNYKQFFYTFKNNRNSTNENKTFTIDHGKHIIKAVISDDTTDLRRSQILLSAWDFSLFEKHPILISQHNTSGGLLSDPPSLKMNIGLVRNIRIEKKQVVAEIEYFAGQGNDEADWAWTLAKNGIAAFSVGAFVKEYEEKKLTEEELKNTDLPTVIYKSVVLHELSQVLTPCNTNCLQKSFNKGNVSEIYTELCFEGSALEKAEKDMVESIVLDIYSKIEKLQKMGTPNIEGYFTNLFTGIKPSENTTDTDTLADSDITKNDENIIEETEKETLSKEDLLFLEKFITKATEKEADKYISDFISKHTIAGK